MSRRNRNLTPEQAAIATAIQCLLIPICVAFFIACLVGIPIILPLIFNGQ